MTGALDDVAFLANSENRVGVLRALASGPRSHDEIRETIGASRVTTARILRELEGREWIKRAGQECTITQTGEWICEEFTRLLGEVAAERRLRDPLQWLPADVVTFDVRCLRDAELVILEERDTTAILRRILDFRRDAGRIRGVTRTVAPEFIENDRESTVEGDTHLDMVVTPGVLETVRTHPTARRQLREMLDEPDVYVSVTEDIPISVSIVDGEVGIDLADEQGFVKAGIVSENEGVYAWAVKYFERHRGAARPVASDDLGTDHSVDA